MDGTAWDGYTAFSHRCFDQREYPMIECNRFQKGSLILVKGKSVSTWYLRFYEDVGGRRVYRKRRIGTSKEYPKPRDAEKAALPIHSTINSGVRTPEKVSELLTTISSTNCTREQRILHH
jgi:hypothetical protein